MEHRWGERIEWARPVRLHVRQHHIIHGRILNLSVSGAYIATADHVPAHAYVDVELDHYPCVAQSRPCLIPAHVVRRTARGIAIEWNNFSPRAIRAAIAELRAQVEQDVRPDPTEHAAA